MTCLLQCLLLCLSVVSFMKSFTVDAYVKTFTNAVQSNARFSNLLSNYNFGKQSRHAMCVGTEVVPTSPKVPNSDGVKFDSDPWQTVQAKFIFLYLYYLNYCKYSPQAQNTSLHLNFPYLNWSGL